MDEAFGSTMLFDISTVEQQEGESPKTFTNRFMRQVTSTLGDTVIDNPNSFSWIFALYSCAILSREAAYYVCLQQPRTLIDACHALEYYCHKAELERQCREDQVQQKGNHQDPTEVLYERVPSNQDFPLTRLE